MKRPVTRFWTDEEGTEYVAMPANFWRALLKDVREGTATASSGGRCEMACQGHGGVDFESGSACCCLDGHCFSV